MVRLTGSIFQGRVLLLFLSAESVPEGCHGVIAFAEMTPWMCKSGSTNGE